MSVFWRVYWLGIFPFLFFGVPEFIAIRYPQSGVLTLSACYQWALRVLPFWLSVGLGALIAGGCLWLVWHIPAWVLDTPGFRGWEKFAAMVGAVTGGLLTAASRRRLAERNRDTDRAT